MEKAVVLIFYLTFCFANRIFQIERGFNIMDRMTVKKIYAGSPEYVEDDLSIVDGTPQYCWEQFWKFAPVIAAFSRGECDFSKPVQRNVARKIYRPERAAV